MSGEGREDQQIPPLSSRQREREKQSESEFARNQSVNAINLSFSFADSFYWKSDLAYLLYCFFPGRGEGGEICLFSRPNIKWGKGTTVWPRRNELIKNKRKFEMSLFKSFSCVLWSQGRGTGSGIELERKERERELFVFGRSVVGAGLWLKRVLSYQGN
jgi:hypothetical protein